jgi:tetratricopeptide (TPR) repeat protein
LRRLGNRKLEKARLFQTGENLERPDRRLGKLIPNVNSEIALLGCPERHVLCLLDSVKRIIKPGCLHVAVNCAPHIVRSSFRDGLDPPEPGLQHSYDCETFRVSGPAFVFRPLLGKVTRAPLKLALIRNASGGLEEVIAARKHLIEAFPGNNDIVEAARNPIRAAIRDRVKDGKYEEALKLTEDSKELLGASNDQELNIYIYDAWAKSHVQAKEWEAAAKVYAAALQHAGDSSLLKNNIEFVYDSWAHGFIEKGEWDNAIRVYDNALNILTDNAHFKQNRAYCVQKKAGVG